MSKWVLDQWDEPLDYPTLGFRANPDAILDATTAPDGRWSLNADQGAAETVTRYAVGIVDPNYIEPGDNHILAWSDPDNSYVPVAPATLLESDEWATSLSASIADTGAQQFAGIEESSVARFIRALERPTRDLYVIMAGDSTLLQTDPWPVKLFRDHIGPRFPAWSFVYDKWNDTTDATDTTTTIQTGSGSFTVHILNLSVSGKTSFYYLTGTRFTKFTGYGGCDLLIYSQGFNEQSSPDLFGPRYLASIESLRTVYPGTEVVLVAENAGASPLTGTVIDNQATRAEEVRRVAAQRGYGLIDAHDLFTKNGSYASWLQADGIHPNDDGMTAIANMADKLFTLPTERGRVVPKSIQQAAFHVSDNLLQFGDLVGWDGTGLPPGAAATVGTVTVAKDTGTYETKGYSVKLTGGGSGTTDYLAFDVPADLLGRLKNGYVTLAARIYVPNGQAHNNAGRVGIDIANDGQSNVSPNGTTTAAGYEGTGGWRWASVRIFVKTIGTRVRARIYCNLSSDGTGGVVYLDRLAVVQGTVPREVGGARSISTTSNFSANVQTFTSSGTWTKPAGATTVMVTTIGAGGGGGSGARQVSGAACSGGAGGGGGGVTIRTFPASVLGSTESVTVGTGGGGGAAQSTNSSAGVNGSAGGNTTFGTSRCLARGGGGGGGGGLAAAATSGTAGGGLATGGTGGAGANGAAGSGGTMGNAAPGGSAGGGISTTPAAFAGATGAASASGQTATATGGANTGAAGGDGTSSTVGDAVTGTSGAGGGASTSTAGGNGGAGGRYGAGGGGGGSSLNGNNSGAGGAGSDGLVVVITF